MLIKVLTTQDGEISSTYGVFKVIKGFADIPEKLYHELVLFKKFYSPLTEEVPKEILDKLAEKDNKKPDK